MVEKRRAEEISVIDHGSEFSNCVDLRSFSVVTCPICSRGFGTCSYHSLLPSGLEIYILADVDVYICYVPPNIVYLPKQGTWK